LFHTKDCRKRQTLLQVNRHLDIRTGVQGP
jgi:hypothetical protein